MRPSKAAKARRRPVDQRCHRAGHPHPSSPQDRGDAKAQIAFDLNRREAVLGLAPPAPAGLLAGQGWCAVEALVIGVEAGALIHTWHPQLGRRRTVAHLPRSWPETVEQLEGRRFRPPRIGRGRSARKRRDGVDAPSHPLALHRVQPGVARIQQHIHERFVEEIHLSTLKQAAVRLASAPGQTPGPLTESFSISIGCRRAILPGPSGRSTIGYLAGLAVGSVSPLSARGPALRRSGDRGSVGLRRL